MGAVDPIGPRALHTETADRIRELIIRCALAPGQRINERLLAARFGISRTPLREALKTLSAEGLVNLLPNRGAVVTTITRADVEDMFQVMAVLEALGGELACLRASDAAIAEIVELHGNLRAQHSPGDSADYLEISQRLHQRIIDCAGNREVTDAYRRISVRIRRARYMADLSTQRSEVMDEHEHMLEALAQRDSQRLKEILALHLVNTSKVVVDWLAEVEAKVQDATG